MTHADHLARALERDPDNELLAEWLVDELVNFRGWTWSEARRAVRRLQSAAARPVGATLAVIRSNGTSVNVSADHPEPEGRT